MHDEGVRRQESVVSSPSGNSEKIYMKKAKIIAVKPSRLSVAAPSKRRNRHTKKDVVKSISYDKDFYKWTKAQVGFLRKKEYSHLDMTNLIEEIESLGKSEKRALHSHLKILLMHLLKQKYQPSKASPSWKTSIRNARDDIALILEDSPSLKRLLPDLIETAYKQARLNASDETGLPESTFPEEIPWPLDQIL